MKLFHRTPEGCAYQPGANWHRAKGWFRLVFFCGECRLYFRVRWKIGTKWAPRVFLRWALRKHEDPSTTWWGQNEKGEWVTTDHLKAVADNEDLRADAEAQSDALYCLEESARLKAAETLDKYSGNK